ncbi:cAMP-regulated phosphoprotein 21 isoform X1 [Nematostella vectensis]|uniref:cAMP-regulated phosphoprotein 21 isoform X1 n=2 Tax=Nematostella vectensis TaxID=45351 RepID=UPI002077393B|nr:cAMP-regulated phosphoprotein 21 isoform X1 [Nematostella vectensis]XP_032233793.2 cAMP-regulated phosphoprotein 21 isoform X1 [Nematostella vectensis]
MMEEETAVVSSNEMTKLQSPTHDNTSVPTVTTAEVSSAETTSKAESPRQQPQAVTMTSDVSSFSSVHVQQSPAFSKMRSLQLTSVSEPIQANPRKMLVRSPAVRSTSSPPLPPDDTSEVITHSCVTNTSFESCHSFDSGIVSEFSSRPENAGKSSKQGSFSRDNSFEYTDSTGTDLNEFIIKTLKNPRDRKFVMKLEHDFLNFIQDPLTIYINYPPMTSYHRMIVHRVAAYFGMDHNVDQQTGKSVIINKSVTTRIPEQRFADLVCLSREESEDSEGAMPRSILRRQNTPSDDSTPPKVDSPIMMLGGMERSKSIEEREEEYVKARQRIFNNPNSRQSSQSSHSSKGDSDMPHPQILTREEAEFLQAFTDEMTPRILKSRSFDERTMDRPPFTGPGIQILSNKHRLLPRSKSTPAYGHSDMPASLASAKHLSGFSGVQYWSPEGVPLVATTLPTGEMVMTPGVLPVMATGPATMPSAGGMIWSSAPPDYVTQDVMLINPNTGSPALGPDGQPLIVQQAYQSMVVKSGSAHAGVQPHPSQGSLQPQGTHYPQGVAVSGASASGQMMMQSPYMGTSPQPVYVMQQQARPPFNQPQMGSEGVGSSQWQAGATPLSSPYQDMTGQMAALTVSGQPLDADVAYHEESVSVASSSAAIPMYGSTMAQASLPGQPGQYQYVIPTQPGIPSQFISPGQAPHMVLPPGSPVQQVPGYQPAYLHTPYQPQYGLNKDVATLSHARSHTPPTPPRTSSPALAQAYTQPTMQVSSLPSHQGAPFRQPQAAPQAMPSMVPMLMQGGHPVPVGGMVPYAYAPPVSYQPFQVQGKYQQAQKRGYGQDRRQQKTSEFYSTEGAPIAYGEPGVVAMDRNLYAQQRFGQVSVGVQYQAKSKSKQTYKKGQGSRSNSGESGTMERQSSAKSLDSDSAPSNVLEVYELSVGIKPSEVEILLEELKSSGALLEWPQDASTTPETVIRAVFPSPSAAEHALSLASKGGFKLRYPGAVRIAAQTAEVGTPEASNS